MQKEKLNRQARSFKEGYIIMPNNFLAEWIRVIGKGPVLLYIQLLTYCHKEKDIAWPALSTLGDSLDMSKNSLISYQKTLLEYGLIKKTTGRRSAQGNYRSNLYKVTPMRSPKNGPGQVQKMDTGSPKFALDQVQNLHPNNTNLNSTNLTATTKREKDAVVAVNFKKLKEKGDLSACNLSAYGHAQAEEKMQSPYSSKEHYTGQAVREQLRDLDFKEEFIEKILKEYSTKKIEEKLDLLMERKNIQNPAGWLMAALKNDYRGEEPSMSSSISPLSFPRRRESSECHDESKMDSHFHGNDIIPNVIVNDHKERSNPKHVNLNSQILSPPEGEGDKILSSEEAARRFHLLRQKLMTMESPLARNVGARCIEPGITERMSTCACTHADRNPPPTFPSPLGGRGSG